VIQSILMKRRHFLVTGAAAAAAGATQSLAQADKRSIIELTYYRTRNSLKGERGLISDYLRQAVMPAWQRAGVAQMGFFSSSVGSDAPYLLSVTAYPSLAQMEAVKTKVAQDGDYTKAARAFFDAISQSYVRMESSLLRGFQSVPGIETPKQEGKPHIFELRVYESNTPATLATKIRMFDEGEVALFRKFGLAPVFFGETIVGRNMPNLTYMVAFKDQADREASWRNFATSPEWKEMSQRKGFSDGEIVSNISNQLLGPLAFSPIR
jgi:hypothetical protein